jgi:hypothetical protein
MMICEFTIGHDPWTNRYCYSKPWVKDAIIYTSKRMYNDELFARNTNILFYCRKKVKKKVSLKHFPRFVNY